MEVEVTEVFAPQAGKRPINFIVLKYFLLGMLFSNGIESILIIPKTLSLMEDNEIQLEKLANLYDEHDMFKQQLKEYSELSHAVVKEQEESFNTLVGSKQNHENDNQPLIPKKSKPKIVFENEEPMSGTVNDTIIEYIILAYGIVTLAIGIVAVFKEQAKLLMLFIGIVAIGLVILFFSGLTLIVFMAILNDVIIALISFKFLQMLNAPVSDYGMYGAPIGNTFGVNVQTATFVQPEQPSYNVDLSGPSNYIQQQKQ